jgi:hypothetical protein
MLEKMMAAWILDLSRSLMQLTQLSDIEMLLECTYIY